jgi:hypothetical protein
MASAVYLAGAARGAPWDREVADDLLTPSLGNSLLRVRLVFSRP